MQTEEMPTVRPKCSPRPAARFEHLDNLQVAGKPVAVDGIERQDISVAPETGIPVEELGLRRGEQRFSCSSDRRSAGRRRRGFRASPEMMRELVDLARTAADERVRSVCLIAVLDRADQLQAASPQFREQPPKPGSHQTLRWREGDSNHRSP